MALLFHQNMRTFGGGATLRNRNGYYAAAFAGIAGAVGAAGPIQVAGFTEVLNNGAAALAFGPAGNAGAPSLCAALGVNHVANIACGQTALANAPEYIAIGVNPAIAIVSVGRFFLQARGGGVALFHDVSPVVPPAAGWCNFVHPNATRDYRGVVYVVVTIPPGVNIAVGFLHNLYTFEAQRVLVMGQLPNIMNAMCASVPGVVAGYIGGDFNSDVLDPRGTRRIGFIHAYFAGLAAMLVPLVGAPPPVPPPPPPPPPPPFVPGGTLWRGNLYDYWYSTIDPAGPALGGLLVPPVPVVDGRTLDSIAGGPTNAMSDHCAALLRI